METKTANYQPTSFSDFYKFENADSEEISNLPVQIYDRERRNILQNIELEEAEVRSMKNPISSEKAFQWLGALLGTFPPMTIFGMLIADGKSHLEVWVVALLIFVNLVCGFTGFFSGKVIGRMVAEAEKWNWFLMLFILPFIGIFWGIMTGGAGGIFLFVIGAIFGAIIAAMVGSVAVTAFAIFHRTLKKGDFIEFSQFLPIAIGITTTICAFILGLNNR